MPTSAAGVQASDFFADEAALRACRKALAQLVFEQSSNSPQSSGTPAKQVLLQLPEHLQLSVLRESAHGLDCHLRSLDHQLQSVAVHAAYPELATEGSLVMKCTDISFASCATVLSELAKLPTVNSFTLHDVSLLTDFKEPVSSDMLKFSFALDAALRTCPHHISLSFTTIPQDHIALLIYSMRSNTHIQSLHLSFPALHPDHETRLYYSLAHLTTLQSLHLADRALLQMATGEQCLTALRSLSLLTSFRVEKPTKNGCYHLFFDSQALAGCLAGMPYLQHIHIPIRYTSSMTLGDFGSVLRSLTCLTCVRLAAFSESGASDDVDADEESDADTPARNIFFECLIPDIASISGLRHLDISCCNFADSILDQHLQVCTIPCAPYGM